MEYRRFDDTIILRLDPDEEIVEQITRVAEAEDIALAEVTGLGALKELNCGLFDTTEKQFHGTTIKEPLEMTSLVGTVTRQDGAPYLHLHINAGNVKGEIFGGHLKSAVISATGEIVIRIINGEVGRKYSDEIGLNLFEF